MSTGTLDAPVSAAAMRQTETGSFMMDLMEATKQRVAQRDIMVLPGGLNSVPDDNGRRLYVNCNEVLADVLAESLRGRRGVVNLNHKRGVIAGHIHDVYFAGLRGGLRASVTWLELADKVICSGEYNSFSPELLFHSGRIIGFCAENVGALLHRSDLPRFTAMAPIKAVTEREAIARQHARFIDLLMARGTTDQNLAENVVALRAARPDLAPAYDLCEGYKAEIAAADAVRLRASERAREAKNLAETKLKATEFIRLVDFRASNGGKLDRSKIGAAFDALAAERPELHAAWKQCHPGY